MDDIYGSVLLMRIRNSETQIKIKKKMYSFDIEKMDPFKKKWGISCFMRVPVGFSLPRSEHNWILIFFLAKMLPISLDPQILDKYQSLTPGWEQQGPPPLCLARSSHKFTRYRATYPLLHSAEPMV
jgi:hypothetical protein